MVSDREPQIGPGPAEEDRSLATHARVFAIAEKYDITCLKTLAVSRFLMHWDNFPCHYSDIASAIRIVYNGTPDSVRGLRECVEMRLLNSTYAYEDKELEIRDAIESVDGLAFNLSLESQRCGNSKKPLGRWTGAYWSA